MRLSDRAKDILEKEPSKKEKDPVSVWTIYLCEKIEERGVACLYVAAGRCGGVAAWRESVFCQRRSVPEYSHRR